MAYIDRAGSHVDADKVVHETKYEHKIVEEDKKEDCKMTDQIAGLLALMQGNKNMDIPGLLALCKEKGYDRGWGGDGMFMFVFLILFLFAGGGWGNFNGRQQADFAAASGQNLQDIIGVYDRFAQLQQNTSNSFAQLDTKICSSIAETIAAVNANARNNYDATRNVGDAVRDCCCTLQAKITQLGCNIDSLRGTVEVEAERTRNVIDRTSCLRIVLRLLKARWNWALSVQLA